MLCKCKGSNYTRDPSVRARPDCTRLARLPRHIESGTPQTCQSIARSAHARGPAPAPALPTSIDSVCITHLPTPPKLPPPHGWLPANGHGHAPRARGGEAGRPLSLTRARPPKLAACAREKGQLVRARGGCGRVACALVSDTETSRRGFQKAGRDDDGDGCFVRFIRYCTPVAATATTSNHHQLS